MSDGQIIQTTFSEHSGLAAGLGSVTGLLVSSAILTLAGASFMSATPAAALLHLSCSILGVIVMTSTVARETPELVVRSALRFMVLALPAFLVLEAAYGGQLYELGGLHVSTDAFIGFRVVAAALLAGIGLPVAERHLDQAFDTNEAFEMETAQARYQAAIERLAAVDIEIERRHTRAEQELAEFDRRLQASGVAFETSTAQSVVRETLEVCAR